MYTDQAKAFLIVNIQKIRNSDETDIRSIGKSMLMAGTKETVRETSTL